MDKKVTFLVKLRIKISNVTLQLKTKIDQKCLN